MNFAKAPNVVCHHRGTQLNVRHIPGQTTVIEVDCPCGSTLKHEIYVGSWVGSHFRNVTSYAEAKWYEGTGYIQLKLYGWDRNDASNNPPRCFWSSEPIKWEK